jgi:hypothetical protein
LEKDAKGTGCKIKNTFLGCVEKVVEKSTCKLDLELFDE